MYTVTSHLKGGAKKRVSFAKTAGEWLKKERTPIARLHVYLQHFTLDERMCCIQTRVSGHVFFQYVKIIGLDMCECVCERERERARAGWGEHTCTHTHRACRARGSLKLTSPVCFNTACVLQTLQPHLYHLCWHQSKRDGQARYVKCMSRHVFIRSSATNTKCSDGAQYA